MSLTTLSDVYIDQLLDLYSANQQSSEVTSELANAATNGDLHAALKRGHQGIQSGMEAVQSILRCHGAESHSEHCKGMEGLVAEARAHALDSSIKDVDVRDAMIISQYQRMAHYAIAGYGCVAAFAKRLGHDEEYETLRSCLDACYDGDRTMSDLAESEVNEAAMA